jgi:hypothetical protein
VVASTLLAIPAAHAVTRRKPPLPVCNLVLDTADVPDSPALHADSADVATNATTLTGVVRVASLAPANDPRTAAGRSWTFVFKLGDKQITNVILDGPLGARDGSGNQAKVTVDPARNQVRYSVSLAQIKTAYGVTVAPGKSVLKSFAVTTAPGIQFPEASAFFQPLPGGDTTAVSARTYKASDRSCVTVGS